MISLLITFQVAIKIINKKRARADRYVSRNLKREAEIMQKVRHRNVVRLLEVMETDSFYYLVTELCCGGELLDLICVRKYLDEDTARKYIAQLVSAVYSMHLSGVLHRSVDKRYLTFQSSWDYMSSLFAISNIYIRTSECTLQCKAIWHSGSYPPSPPPNEKGDKQRYTTNMLRKYCDQFSITKINLNTLPVIFEISVYGYAIFIIHH